MSLDLVRVKREPEWQCGVSLAAARAGLYADHTVKQEMVLGPELLQPPDYAFVPRAKTAVKAPEQRADAGGVTADPTMETKTYRHTNSRDRVSSVEPPIKQEAVCDARDPPMVHIHNSCLIDDFCGKREVKQEPDTFPEGESHPQTPERTLQERYIKLFGIKPCTVRLVCVDEKISRKTNEVLVDTNAAKRKKDQKQKKFTCDYCAKDFSMKANLKVHLRTHTGEKPYVCNVCKKTFSDVAILIRHRRIHTGEKPHTCDVCHKQFSEKYLLRYHKRLHTGEKPYSCQYCGKKYNHISNLKRHSLSHVLKPLTCDICSSHFGLQSRLEAHLLGHAKDKPFVCEICQKCFANRGHLKRHLETHSGVKPYSCAECGARFSQRSALKKHSLRQVCGGR